MNNRPSGDEEKAMRLPRFQFTIRRLIVWIAIFGVCFALLRTPFGFVVVCVGAALPGFFIGRARGGSGIISGALSEAAVFGLLMFALILRDPLLVRSQFISQMLVWTTVVTACAFVFGLLISCALFVAFELRKLLFRRQQQDRSSYFEEIRWLTPDGQPPERR
jgi:hypothetical protein